MLKFLKSFQLRRQCSSVATVGSSPTPRVKDGRLAISARLMLRRLEAAPSQQCRQDVLRSKLGLMRNCNFWKPLIQTLQKKARSKFLCIEVFDWIRQEFPDASKPQIYSNMIAYAGSIGMPQLAHAWVSEMKIKGIKMSTPTYNALVSVFCRSGEIEAAEKMLENMKWAECPPNVSTYNTILAAYGRSSDIVQMEKWLEELRKAGLTPNVVTYNTLLFSYLKKGSLAKVDETYREMQLSCKPDVFTFGILLHGYQKLNMVERMEQAFADRQKSGLPVGAIAAQRMIRVYTKNKMFSKIKDITAILEQAPRTVYTTRLNGVILDAFLSAGGFDQVEHEMKRVVKQGRAFMDPEVLDEVVSAFFENSAAENLGGLYRSMKAVSRWRMYASTYELLVRGFAKHGDGKMAMEVSEDMEMAGWKWSVDTMQVLYDVFKKAGDREKLGLIVEKMEKL
ncbi:pentatricopeptide repeat-containing protein At5g01110-like [Selaginella moellendorffii]|nr:pentatricopeptide repeat-containing protein At5g01110-like [Selaginella moellendorffii]|eukprot:XP_024514974.1 pentatricopeptide repeat-containing protein At5g01110-like [Selaginella moellendorffii]